MQGNPDIGAPLTYLTLRRLGIELAEALVGRRITNADLVTPLDLHLHLEGGAGLLLSASPERGRVLLTAPPRSGPDDTPAWAGKHLLDGRIVAVSQPVLERILIFDVTKRDRLGGRSQCRLIAEVMGKHSNVILVSVPESRVVAALRHVR